MAKASGSVERYARGMAARAFRVMETFRKASLYRLVADAKIPRDAPVLTIGATGQAAKSQIDLTLARHKGRRIAIGDPSAQGEKIAGDPFTLDLPDGLGACFVALTLARIPDLFEELLHHGLKTALRPGGVAALQFCRDASEPALEKLKAHVHARATLRAFLKHHFGREVVSAQDIARKFQDDPDFEFAGLAPRGSRPAGEEAVVWIVLRRRARSASGAHAFPRSPRADRYRQAEFATLVDRFSSAGIAFVPIDEFVARLSGPPGGFGVLKFDIHSNIRRSLEIGEILRRRNLPGLFLMMHRHALSADYYDAPFTWRVLRALQDMGHEIGLHLDPFHIVREHGDLSRGIALALADMRARGLVIRSATLHGDTAPHLRARNLLAFDFFQETRFRSSWDGKAPEGEPFLAEHFHRYAFADLAREHGLRWFVETSFVADGEVLTSQRAYLSDNNQTMLLTGPRRICDAAPFRISGAFTTSVAEVLRGTPFLALFHPQWIW